MHFKITHTPLFTVDIDHPLPVYGLIQIQVTGMVKSWLHLNQPSIFTLPELFNQLLAGREIREF